jgi:hypothetical protein
VERWEYTSSARIIRELIGERMFPVTLAGLDSAISELRRPLARAAPVSVGATYPTAGEPPEAPRF